MQVPLQSMNVERAFSDDRGSVLVEVRFTANLPPKMASNLARILSTNVLEVQDAEWQSLRMEDE